MTTQTPLTVPSRDSRPRRAREAATLVLEDGRTFRGASYGALGETVGEAVFSTGMTGYQETLTDPSYHRQVIVMTAPHVGNTGVNAEDDESTRIWVAGYVVRDPAIRSSNWRATRRARGRARRPGRRRASASIDTRALTRHLRERGAMRVGIFSGDAADRPDAELLDAVRTQPADGRRRARRARSPRPSRMPSRPSARSASPSPPSTSASRR